MDESIKRITVKYLRAGGLETAAESGVWMALDEEKEVLDICMNEYEQLISLFNKISTDDPRLWAMPVASHLKETLGETPLPSFDEMGPGNYVPALKRSRDLMLQGQSIKKGELENTPENSELAIGTTSYDVMPGPRTIGAAAHLVERTFFEWAKRNGIYPKGKRQWMKDDWLHAMKEVMLLSYAEGRHYWLREVFHDLNWLDNEKETAMVNKLKAIMERNQIDC